MFGLCPVPCPLSIVGPSEEGRTPAWSVALSAGQSPVWDCPVVLSTLLSGDVQRERCGDTTQKGVGVAS